MSRPVGHRARRVPRDSARRARALVAVAWVATAGCAGRAAAPGGPVPAAPLGLAAFTRFVDSLADAPAFRNAHWGILIVDPDAGDTLYARNAGKLFLPASNQKILTGATALTQLGPDYRFVTRFAGTGPVDSGVLRGDLVVIPSGDPTFSDTMWRSDYRNAFRAMADSLVARGVRHVAGGIVRSGAPFTDEPCGFGWELDDLDTPSGACVQDLFVNEGRQRVPRARFAGDTVMRTVAIRDPRGAFFAALRDALVERGITVAGAADTSRVAADSGLVPLFAMQSPPLTTVLTRMMKPSQNQVAEILLKTLGRERAAAGRADSGRRVVERQLLAWGIDSTEFAVRDGSGLSRHDYVTPRAIVRVLDALRRHPAFDAWYAALPIAGVDGTIASRMRGTPAQGNVRAKTGTVDKARSLSGYVTTADGRMLLFSMLCNNFTVPVREVERVQDQVLTVLAGHARPRR